MIVDKVQTSRNLRVLMAARHADVASLASALNVSRTTVYNYLEAKRTPDPELVAIVNEEGLIIGLPLNRHFDGRRWYHGTVLVVRAPYWAEDFESITLEDLTTLATDFGIGIGKKVQFGCNLEDV